VRICFVGQQIGEVRTGVGTYANTLVPAVSALGHEVTLVGRGTTSPPGAGITFHRVPSAAHDPTPESWLSFAWLASRRLRALDARFDVVHFLDGREALFTTTRAGATVLGTVHDCYLASAPSGPAYWRQRYGDWAARWAYHTVARRLERRALRRMDALLTNSDYVGRQIAHHYGIDAARIHPVHLGVQIEWPPGDPAAREPEVLFVGANFERKGLPGLLRAIADIASTVPDVRLHVVGDHASRARMQALARALGIERRVTFHGFVDRAAISARYRAAAVVALPSEIEGFGLSLVEAMHTGVPVIASTEGGSGEIVRDGWNGFLVAPGDVPSLTDRLRRLLTDEERRQEMGRNAREMAARLTPARMVDETLAVYRAARRAQPEGAVAGAAP
jgi:glycosyltransferase involved in cell wall biosynthesis